MDKTIVNLRRPFNTVPSFLISYYHFLFPLESNGLSVYITDSFFRRIANNGKRFYMVSLRTFFTYSLNSSRNVSLNFLQTIFITIQRVFTSFQRFDNYLVQILNFDALIMSLTMCVDYRAPHESSRCSDTYEGNTYTRASAYSYMETSVRWKDSPTSNFIFWKRIC